MRGHRFLGAWGWTNGASSDETQALCWLEEFFSPWMEIGAADEADYEITYEVGPRDWDSLRAEIDREPSGSAESFVQDGRTTLDPCWRNRDGSTSVRLGKGSATYRIDAPARRARVVAEQDDRRARLALLRAVRELAIIGARRRGALLVHGAALARAGRVIAVCGAREAGKTTFLLHALADRAYGLVANDRLLVRVGPEGATARGVPTIVSIREGTLALLPALAERLRQSGFAYELSFAEIAAAASAGARAVGNPSPRQLCELLGVEAVAEGPLAAIVFPSRAAGAELRLERVAIEEAVPLIRASLLGPPGAWPSASLWLGPDLTAEPTKHASDEHCHALARQIPVHRCAIGPDALADQGAMTDLLAELATPHPQ